MSNLHFLFRADSSNVGDWWCPPFKYFPFRPAKATDIINENFKCDKNDILILGGGGIGNKFFNPHLERIKRLNYSKTILWGAGVDNIVDKTNILQEKTYDLYGDYFDFIDEVGIRVFSKDSKFKYIPCSSCMSNLFFKFRDIKPTKQLGVFSHKRVSINLNHQNDKNNFNDNSGNNLEEKLEFLSQYEFILTNTYHGAYWATLLQRKVIVIPFKSGLFSFKYKPAYSYDGNLSDNLLDSCKIYEGVLEESRKLNLNYYKYLTEKYYLV